MTINQFIAAHYKTKCRYNKTTTGYQCVDLAKALCVEYDKIDAYRKFPSLRKDWAWGNACDWAIPNSISSKLFKFTDCTKSIPAGSLIVFKTSSQYGHIAVATGFQDDEYVVTLDQNYGKTESAQFVKHKINTIRKVLIPIG